MTCIVGIETPEGVIMGGDSCGSNATAQGVYDEPKVFRNGELLIGYTSSFRMGQLLRHALRIPKRPKGKSDEAYLVTDVTDAIRKCLKDGGYMSVESGVETGGFFLLAYHGKLYEAEDNAALLRSVDGYAATGCGAKVALGALHAARHLTHRGKDGESLVRAALAAAAHHVPGVLPPFVILKEWEK